jgi:PhnB protein
MQSRLTAYIHFKDTARQAMEFYHSVLGGKLTVSTFRESHAGESDNVMLAALEVENGMHLMAADTPPGMEPPTGANMSITLSGDDEQELTGYWKKLSEGAEIDVALDKAPWGDTFGILTDKFGVRWMVNITGKKG